jgi:hypothetical protein
LEPHWDELQTRTLFLRVCGNCHSNETRWPWYSHLAPMSWLVQRDVEEGRSHFNVSEWDREEQHGDEAAERLRDGAMPPWFYLPAHPEARLDPPEERALVAGLVATFGEESEASEESDEHNHHDHHTH